MLADADYDPKQLSLSALPELASPSTFTALRHLGTFFRDECHFAGAVGMSDRDAPDLEAVAGWLRGAIVGRRAHRRGHLDRVGHPRLPRAERRVDQEPGRREDRDARSTTWRDPEVRRRAWQNRLKQRDVDARSRTPRTTRSSSSSARARCTSLVTQNVDGLHHAAGQSPEIVVEIHGNVREAKCMSCGWRGPDGRRRSNACAPARRTPRAEHCGGILKSATISFGENLVADDLERSQRGRGPRRRVPRARHVARRVSRPPALPEIALRNGARLVIVNAEETPFDPVADVVLRRPARRRAPRARGARLSRLPPRMSRPRRWEYPTGEVGFTSRMASLPRPAEGREGRDPRDRSRRRRGAARRRDVPRRARARRVRAGHDPRRGVHPPRPPRERRSRTSSPTATPPIVIYCAGGNRSAFAAKTLQELGYSDVVSMTGGFGRWKNEGRDVDHARGARPRAAQPLQPPPPPARGR